MTEQTRAEQTVMLFFGALGSGDFAALPDLASNNISYTIYSDENTGLPWSGRHTGLTELESAFRAIHGAMEVHSFEVEDIVSRHDVVSVFGAYEATMVHSGARFRTPFAQRARLAHGKVSDCIMLEDSQTVLSAFASTS